MSLQSISRRYAVALADVLGEIGEEAFVDRELREWEEMMMSSSELREVLANPTVPYEQKRLVLNELIKRTGVSQTTANFLQVLLKNQRLLALPQINAKLGEVLDDRAGAVAAHVTTAKPINEETKRLLADKLSRHTGKSVRLDFSIDDSLIGGIVTRVGSTIYDGSIKTQLKEMEKVLSGQA